MAFNETLNTIQCQNGTGFMPCYKLSRTDCATVTHLYNLRPNTEQRHAIRTVRNIVKQYRCHVYMSMRFDMYICLCALTCIYVYALHHIEKSMCPPHGIMGRLCLHVTIFWSKVNACEIKAFICL